MAAADETASVWWLLRAIEADPDRRRVARSHRVLTVSRPWAWLLWHYGPLQSVDPDEENGRSPREISTLNVEWGLVLHAATYAVMQLRLPDRELLFSGPVDVEVPFPLSDVEWELAQGWVGEASPVMVRVDPDDPAALELPEVVDGRHRLWLTRQHQAQFGTPVLAESLLYVGDHLAGELQELLPAEVTLAALEDAGRWWETHPVPSIRSGYRDTHLRMMAHSVVALGGAPTPAWFERLAPWDGWIEHLVDLHERGLTDAALLENVLVCAWSGKQDRVYVDPAVVRSMFASLGFNVNGFPARRPRPRTLVLFRGATEAGRHGPSWTTSPGIAQHFASVRQRPGSRAEIWQVRVPSSRVLAVVTDEQECILDLDGAEDAVVGPELPNVSPAAK